jgi:hypothetical protein
MRDLSKERDESMTPNELEAYFADSTNWERWEGRDEDGALVHASLWLGTF